VMRTKLQALARLRRTWQDEQQRCQTGSDVI
jgi:hypothetical protein